MASILSYGCTSAAGLTSDELWNGLWNGQDFSKSSSIKDGICTYEHPNKVDGTQKEMLLRHLLLSWKQTHLSLAESSRLRIKKSSGIGVIFASTKGFIDDVIWCADSFPKEDTLSPLLNDFVLNSDLKVKRQTCISNACASSIAALYLATKWLENKTVDDVLIISADAVGSFVLNGFQSLRVLTKDKTRPFSENRTGFFLGEATASILLSNHSDENSFELKGIAIDSEGYAVTRPSQSGESLKRAINKASGHTISKTKSHESENVLAEPSVILAHATSTQVNDAVEDQVFYDLFWSKNIKPIITASKWCTGHTMAVSGALDIITSCEILKNQKIFAIANSEKKDPKFKCEYYFANSSNSNSKLEGPIESVLVTSLGFGGLHGAAMIEKSRAKIDLNGNQL